MKILIIGAGPIGCYTAQLLKNSDKASEITIIEEHEALGRPLHCAGLVSKDVFKDSLVSLDPQIIINRIDGADIFLDGAKFTIRRDSIAFVIDREKFDSFLGSGLDIRYESKFIGAEKEKGGYLIETDKGEHYADILIGADGANSSVRRILGFQEELNCLKGVQFRMTYKTKKNFVQVHLKKPFFAWIIPENENIIRAGIISQNPYHDLINFLKETKIRGEILDKFAGIVPLGICETHKENIFLVGDAACQIKPLTQGGIYYGMRCAEILADCILKRKFNEYERKWQERFSREIEIGLKLRKIYESLDKDSIAKIFYLLKKNRLLLEKFGDFEKHSKVLGALLKHLHIKSFFGKILLSIIKDVTLKQRF